MAVCVLAALALPARAVAHHSPPIIYTAFAGSTPTIDGSIGSGEWSDTPAYDVAFAGHPAVVRFKHDATNLYVLATISDAAPVNAHFTVYFDDNHDGLKQAGEDAILGFPTFGSDFFYSPDGTGGASHYSDLSTTPSVPTAGTNDVIAAGTSDATSATIEMSHPLCTSDTAHDVCLTAGATAGVDFQYEASSTPFVRYPGADAFNPGDWADLVVSAAAFDTTPPTVTLTQPPAGSVLRGTVAVAATASDDVGVTRVDFSYLGRRVPGGPLVETPISSDSTAPYTASFDTTQVPNTAVLDATIYADAFDAAGNHTKIGNGITIDNAAGRIVFETDRDGNSEIYRMDTDGTNPTRLTTNAAVDTRPSLSPDGGLVAFESTRSGTRQVWVMNIDGSNQHALTTAGNNGAPAFSPDGSKIAFESNRDGNWEIYVMNADGSGQTNLTRNAASDVGATWKPDGTQVAFDSDRAGGGNRDIFTMNSNGTGQTDLTPGVAAIDADPDWSPDAQSILFVSGRGSTTSVWKMNADGTSPQNVTNATIYDADPAWAPDGQHIAFVRDAGGQNFNVWTARPDGSAQLKLTNGTAPQRNSFPDWGRVASVPTSVTIALRANTATTEAGARTVKLADIPVAAINGSQAATSKTAPLDTIPLDTIPLDTIDFATSPLDTIPLDTIGLSASTLLQNALGGEPLSHIPLRSSTWEAKLLGTPLANLPIVSLTLADVAQQAPAVMHSLTLGDINLALSPLDTIPLAGAALGKTPLDTIPVQGHTGAQNQADWCTLIHAIPGFAGFDCSTIPATTAMGLTLQGVPLDTIPLDTIPLDTIDLSQSPLDTIPLDTIPLQTLQNSPLDTIPLDTIDFATSPLDTIPLDTIPTPNAVVQCESFTCPGHTLGQAAAANKLRPGATFGDIAKYPGVTLGNVGRGMPPNVTLQYLFALLFGSASYDWESLPLDFPAQDFSSDGPKVSYAAVFQVDGPAPSATITVTLTGGERYVPGSTQIAAPASVAEPTVTESEGVETVKWTVTGFSSGVGNELHFDTRPGTVLGTDTAKAAIDVQGVSATSAVVPLRVTDTFEGNGDAGSAKPLAPGSFAFSYVTSAGDRDFWRIDPDSGPVGTQTQIFLSHIPAGADYDLIVYGAAQQALRSAPLDTIPLDTIGPGEAPPDLQQRSQDVPPEPLGDIAVDPPPGMVVLGTSDVRGNGNEEVDVASTGNGPLVVEVVSTTGEFSDQPYVLRMAQTPAPSLPQCHPRTMGTGGMKGPMPQVAANVNTLFLINAKQFGDLNGAQDETLVMNALTALAGSSNLGVIGAVIPVELDATTASAYGAWNADPCSPEKANDVVRAIGELLDGLESGRDIKNVVIVGGDDVIPMGRITNPTPLADEAGYASTFGFDSNNELVSAFAERFLLTDDVYADPGPQQFLGGQLYVPDVAVGRLIDKPSEILAQISAFTANNGLVNPKTELSTGYGFLADGAQATAANFKAAGRTGTDLINETWTSGDLEGRIFPTAGQQPKLMALNAHYDHNRLLPADQNAANLQTNLFTTDKLTAHGAGSTNGLIVTTVGCHSGVNVPDSLGLGAALSRDWPQAYTQTGNFAFNGNSGYGLGDTVAVAYSERLQANFAKNMDGSMTIGDALAFAKQDYLGGLNAITNYDVKVINESTLYGLPMWKLGTESLPPAPQPPPTFTDPSGLQATAVSITPTFTQVNTPGYGTYFTVGGQAELVNRRPIEPSTTVDVTVPDLVAHGFLITSLASTDQSIDAAWSRVVTDSAVKEPELVGLTIFPTQLQNIRTVTTPIGQRQKLVLALGQFRDDGVPDPAGAGTQRLFTEVSGRVLFAPPAARDFVAPRIGPVTVAKVGSNVSFTFTGSDKTDTGAGTIKRAAIIYKDNAVWRLADAQLSNGVFSGSGPLAGDSTTAFIQLLDASGNVAVASFKGTLESAVPPPAHGPVTATITGPQTNGWFTGTAAVTLSGGAPGVGIQFSLDFGAFQPYSSPVQVTGDGTHRFEYRTDDNSSSGVVFVPIDTTGPKIVTGDRSYVLKSTGNSFDVVCSDAGSGIASCTTTPAVPDTSTIGEKQFTVNASDRVGNTATATGRYHVVYGFKGFFQPISNLPFMNQVNAGSGVPVKFSLSGNQGSSIFATGNPRSQQISCDASAPVDDSIPTVTTGGSSLSYDAASDQYTYLWKTDKAWAGTCRQLIVGFADGTIQRADFKFK